MTRFEMSISAALLVAILIVLFGTASYRNQAPASEQTTFATLPAPSADGTVPLDQALRSRRSMRSYSSAPLTLAEVSQLLWAAQGITDDKGHRTAPSAMAKYPLTLYVIAGNVTGLPDGIYRYESAKHRLALVSTGDRRSELLQTVPSQSHVKAAPASIVIAGDYSVFSESANRAARYTHIEAGAAGQNALLEATALGLAAVGIGGPDDDKLRELIQAPETQTPLYTIVVGRGK